MVMTTVRHKQINHVDKMQSNPTLCKVLCMFTAWFQMVKQNDFAVT